MSVAVAMAPHHVQVNAYTHASRLQSSHLHVLLWRPTVAAFTIRRCSQDERWFWTSRRSFPARLATSSSLTSYSLCVPHLVFKPLASKTKVFMTHNRKTGTYFRLKKKKSATRMKFGFEKKDSIDATFLIGSPQMFLSHSAQSWRQLELTFCTFPETFHLVG